MNLSRVMSILAEPISAEMRGLLQARWEELPEDLRQPWQVVGQHYTHCGYTLGPAYCSFGCTHCYLPKNANHAPLPTLDEMREQIDANRRFQGHGGGLQITGGDVVDAYFRAGRPEELIEIVRYANNSGVIPMLMTHGQKLLEHPEFLEELVVKGGLRKLAVHIDITMAGRPGFPIKSLKSEADLHPLRESFIDLILAVRKKTGKAFFAAHAVTVTEANLPSVGEVVRFLMSKRRNLDAFRLVSFQTEADVGRTRFSARPVTAQAVWDEVCAAVGVGLSRNNFWFGHPDCSNLTSLLVTYPEQKVVNMNPGDEPSHAYWGQILKHFGGVGGRGESFAESVLRKLAVLARHPSMVPKTIAYAVHRLRQEGLGPRFFWQVARGQVGGLNIVLHNFMSQAEVASGSEEVKRRLAACSFRGAVRQDGQWKAVPMCQMNALEREGLYDDQIVQLSARAS